MAKFSEAKQQGKFIRSGSPLVTVGNRDQFLKLEGVDKIVEDLIKKYYYAPDGSSLAQKELVKIGAIASGNLAFQGLQPVLNKTNTGYVIEFHLNRDTPYWKDIENGVPPGRHVPYQALQIWISQKPTIQSKLSILQAKWKFKTKEKTAMSLAKMISNSIYEKGIKPKGNFFSKQHDPFLKELKSKLPKALGDSIKLTILDAVKKK